MTPQELKELIEYDDSTGSLTWKPRADRNPAITAHMATFINVRRNALGLSLGQLAGRAGSSKAHIWALERGQSKNPTLWLILALCEALQCSLNSLIGMDVSQPMFSEQEMALVEAHRRIFSHTVGDNADE